MILFPVTEEQNPSDLLIPIWKAVEESQKRRATDYWLVTQPAHAALAGELASALREDLFGPVDATVARSIALHDAGWSLDDAEQIQRLRSDPKLRPSSFLEASMDQALRAWDGSIVTAEKFAPIGGYLVSRHFERLSKRSGSEFQAKAESFRKQEAQRQQNLRKYFRQDQASVERLVDALQFCDVLSLYLCCGSARPVEISEQKIIVSRSDGDYRMVPSPFNKPRQFSFSALRHPVRGSKQEKSGATFYINL